MQPLSHLHAVTLAIGCGEEGLQLGRLINGEKTAQGLANHLLFRVTIKALGSRAPGFDSSVGGNGKHRIL